MKSAETSKTVWIAWIIMINLFQNSPLGFRHFSFIQSCCHSRGSFTKSCLRNVLHVGAKRQNWSKKEVIFKFLAIAHFPSKRLAIFCSSHEVMFSSPKEIYHCEILHIAPCRRSHMNISRHIKNIGFIRFKFLTKFPSKQQLSGFFSSNCQSTKVKNR